MPSPAILGLGAPGFLACRLRCRWNRRGRRLGLLPFGLLLTQALLLTSLTLELVLLLTQAVLLLPGLRPALIEQRQPHREHRIDMFGFPMHPWPFETGLHHQFMTAFHTSRPNRPPRGTVGGIVHQVAPLLQVVHLLLDLRVAPG